MLLAVIAVMKAYHVVLGHNLTAAQVGDVNALWITVRSSGPGPDRAVAVDGVGERLGPELGTHPVDGAVRLCDAGPDRLLRPPGFRVSLVLTVFGPTVTVLYWLVGLAVVWLLWRPTSSAFFKPPGYTQAQHQAQMADRAHQAQMTELARIRSSRAQFLRQGVSRVDQPTRAADS